MATRVRARAYTSIANLGYGLDTLGVCVDAACDEVEAREASHELELEVVGPFADEVPSDPDANSAGLAVRSLLEAHDLRTAVSITLTKGIRPGSGLGSSAASAAAAVTAVNALLSLGRTPAELVRHAAQGERASAGVAHADNVAAALVGGFTIVGGGEFDVVLSVGTPNPPCFVVALPAIRVATRDGRAALPQQVPLRDYVDGAARVAAIVAAWQAGDVATFGRAIEGSFVDAARAAWVPGFDRACEAAHRAGAAGVTISGSGPAVFAVVAEPQRASTVGEALRTGFAAESLACEIFHASIAGGAQMLEVDR